MIRSLPAVLLACACATAMSAVAAGEVERLSPADAGCPADVAAAKAEAADEARAETTPGRSPKPTTAPVRGKPSVRGADTAPTGSRLQAPRWHSFLPGMFR